MPDPEDIHIRRARQAEEGKVAMKEYRAKADALVKNTERLRAERLAREARDAEKKAAPAPKEKKPAPSPKKAPKGRKK